MTDNEIIKALECCANADGCEDCPRSKQCDGVEHVTNALDLINRQKAEIERLTEQFHYLDIECVRLEKANETATAEAIKEFAERLKEHACCYDLPDYHSFSAVDTEDIDNLVKEMVGDTE